MLLLFSTVGLLYALSLHDVLIYNAINKRNIFLIQESNPCVLKSNRFININTTAQSSTLYSLSSSNENVFNIEDITTPCG